MKSFSFCSFLFYFFDVLSVAFQDDLCGESALSFGVCGVN